MIANSRVKEEMEGDDAHVNLTKGSGKEEWGGDISEASLAELDDAAKAQGLGGLLNEIQHRQDEQNY